MDGMAAHTRVICDRCGCAVPLHAHYRVRIEVVADPSPVQITQDDLDETDFDWTLTRVIEETKHATAEELEDAIAKSFEFRICRPCQLRFIRSPLGETAGPEGSTT